jgi:cytochrome c556
MVTPFTAGSLVKGYGDTMFKKAIRASLFTALGLGVMLLAYGSAATGADDKIPTVKEIMTQGHKGTDSLLGKLKGEVKGEKWEDATTNAKALVVFGEALGKNKATKGDEKSWKTLSDKYLMNTKAVLTAVEKKDAKGANAALAAIGKSCGECHKAHK